MGDVDSLMAIPAFCERILRWAAQEAAGSSADAFDNAVDQAMKMPVAKRESVQSTPRAGERVKGAATDHPAQTLVVNSSGSNSRGGWLPQKFVEEFNAEGDEVEPAHETVGSDAETDANVKSVSFHPAAARKRI